MNTGLIQTEIHTRNYASSYPNAYLLGVKQVDTSKEKQEQQPSQEIIEKNEVWQKALESGINLASTIADISNTKTVYQTALKNAETARIYATSELEKKKYELQIVQAQADLAVIMQAQRLAEIKQNGQSTKTIVYGVVAVAGVVSLGLVAYAIAKSRK